MRIGVAALGAAILGYVVIGAFAAGVFAQFELETSAISGQAAISSNSGASGGKLLTFGSGAMPQPVPITAPLTTQVPTPAPPAPTTCMGIKHTAGGDDGRGGCWPGASNTGVPTGIALSNYPGTGVCSLTVPNQVIDAKTFTCDLVIKAAGITITRSNIVGRIVSTTAGGSVSISDTTIDGGQQETYPSVGYQGITLNRVEVIGGQHSVQCYGTCNILNSWLHNQYLPSTSNGHVNAFISNGGGGFTLNHNTLHCTVIPTAAGGCTADASLFGDFGPINGTNFNANLFVARNDGAGYCLQAGWNPSKAYPVPSNVSITNNVFQRGANGHCGIYGVVTAYYIGNGDVWSNNKYDNDAIINP